MLDALRPKPFRGDQVAAGVVVLTVLAALLSIRFRVEWAPGAHLTYVAVAAAFVMSMALLSPLDGPHPRAFQTVLYVASFALGVGCLVWLAVALDGDERFAAVWIAALLCAQQAVFSVGRQSPTATLLSALSGALAVVAFVTWVGDDDPQAVRWALAAVIATLLLLVLGQRDRRPAHAAQLANAGGLAAAVIAATGAVEFFGLLGHADLDDHGVGWGWELLVLAAGFGLVSYGAVDHERGPAVLGVLDLIAFVLLTAFEDSEPTLVGWPLALGLAAGFLLVTGLRPTTPAPPPPDVDRPAAGTIELPRPDEPEL